MLTPEPLQGQANTSVSADRAGSLIPGSRVKVLTALGAVALLILAGLLAYGYASAVQASSRYQQARTRLDADIRAAQREGLPAANLSPITTELSAIDASQPPLWPTSRTDFYLNDARTAAQLDAQLESQRQLVLHTLSSDAATQLAAVNTAIAHDEQIDVPAGALADFRQRAAVLTQATAGSHIIKDWLSLDGQAVSLHNDVAAAGARQDLENTAIQQAASEVLQQAAGNIDAVQQAGNAALASGRDDATVAAYEAKPGRFGNITALMDAYNQAEHYSGRLASPDPNQVAFGTAAIQRYSGQVHQMSLAGLGPKHIIVSFQAQHVWVYENGQVVMESPVTTGIRGATAYGTDFGPMKVQFRSHPFTMHSPWPRGSIYWYPDTVVQWTTFFTNSGESFHDAFWEPDSLLGPGSQYNSSTRSHGCIHVPSGDAQWMFNWATEGTPVDVIPGNGQPVAEQLSEITTDNQGNPLNPA